MSTSAHASSGAGLVDTQLDDLVSTSLLVLLKRGELLGVPATNRKVVFQAVEMYQMADGKIADQWDLTDALGLLQQFGAIPTSV